MTGNQLKSIRKARGLSVKDLAKQLNINFNTIYAWESGAKEIPPKRIKDLDKALVITRDVDLDKSNLPLINSQIVPPDPDPKITFVEEIDKAIKMAIKSGDSEWCIVILPLPDNNVDIRVCARRKDGS